MSQLIWQSIQLVVSSRPLYNWAEVPRMNVDSFWTQDLNKKQFPELRFYSLFGIGQWPQKPL